MSMAIKFNENENGGRRIMLEKGKGLGKTLDDLSRTEQTDLVIWRIFSARLMHTFLTFRIRIRDINEALKELGRMCMQVGLQKACIFVDLFPGQGSIRLDWLNLNFFLLLVASQV